jgi:hypothetical protein
MQRSVSVTDSSKSPSASASRLATPDTEASVAASLTNALDNVHLSSPVPVASSTGPDGFDMSVLAAAIETVEQGADEQNPLPGTLLVSPRALRPPDTSQSRPGSRRRSNRRASDRVISYDLDEEELPPHQLYSPEVQQALRNSKSLMESLSAALGSSSSRMHKDQGSTIHGLHEQAAALANFQLPPSWTIGFVGGTGAGKVMPTEAAFPFSSVLFSSFPFCFFLAAFLFLFCFFWPFFRSPWLIRSFTSRKKQPFELPLTSEKSNHGSKSTSI